MAQHFLLPPSGVVEGPVDDSEVVARIGCGAADASFKICALGDHAWRPISDHAAFAEALASATATGPFAPAGSLPHLSPSPGSASAGGTAPMVAPPFELSFRAAPVAPTAMSPTAAGSLAPRILSQPPTAAAAPSRAKLLFVVAGAAIGLLALLGVAGLALRSATSRDTGVKSAVVRVATPSGSGSGFFILGPDDLAYVATAYHVIDRGEHVLVERNVEVSDKTSFVEAYPETEVVAFDAEADVAIIRLKNVHAKRFENLGLAQAPVKDEKVQSYGFPASSLARRAGLVSKEGKVLSLVKFPVIDKRYDRVVRDNAVEGLLISSDIEPGFSGGPTCNEAGEVVGINVTKDRAHVGQNGAVSVAVLRQLAGTIRPAAQADDPKPEDVTALLKRIQGEYLMHPRSERSKVRETELVSASELPPLRKLINEIRRYERNTDPDFIPKLKLSGQAAVGIYFATLPGVGLETYTDPSTKEPIAKCEQTNHRLISFLGELGVAERGEKAEREAADGCDELAIRPLVWDLTAATLQWDGKERDYSATKIEKADEEGTTYRATVRATGLSNVFEIWVTTEQGRLRLKLLDDRENVYAFKSARNVSSSAFTGTWSLKKPRVANPLDPDTEMEADETLSISFGDDRNASIKHTVAHRYFVPEAKTGTVFTCSRTRSIDIGLEQNFAGPLDNGTILAAPQRGAEIVGANRSCKIYYGADKIVALKLVGEQLVMVRSDGRSYPEQVRFSRK